MNIRYFLGSLVLLCGILPSAVPANEIEGRSFSGALYGVESIRLAGDERFTLEPLEIISCIAFYDGEISITSEDEQSILNVEMYYETVDDPTSLLEASAFVETFLYMVTEKYLFMSPETEIYMAHLRLPEWDSTILLDFALPSEGSALVMVLRVLDNTTPRGPRTAVASVVGIFREDPDCRG